MRLPVQITFRRIPHSEAVAAAIRERAAKLDRFCDLIMGCRVVVEACHRRHRQGTLYHIRIDLTVPGEEIIVSREPALQHAHEDIYVTIRDAFDAARRRLEVGDLVRFHEEAGEKGPQASTVHVERKGLLAV